MASNPRFTSWFVRDTNWSRAALPLAAVLSLLSPFLRRGLDNGTFSVFAQLPVYLLHQYEEHGHSAFKEYGNRELLRNRGRLTDGNIFVINILGVWVLDLVALYLARYRNRAAGLIAPYLAIMNSLIHLGAVIRSRRYNPGAWTAGLLLLPAGIYSVVAITRTGPTSVRDHARGFLGAVLVHVLAMVLILSGWPEPEDKRLG